LGCRLFRLPGERRASKELSAILVLIESNNEGRALADRRGPEIARGSQTDRQNLVEIKRSFALLDSDNLLPLQGDDFLESGEKNACLALGKRILAGIDGLGHTNLVKSQELLRTGAGRSALAVQHPLNCLYWHATPP